MPYLFKDAPIFGVHVASSLNVGSGTGYTDVSPKQVVRTSGNTVYLIATNCDSYPCTANTQTVRVYKGDSTGVPTSFTRKDSANEPADAGTCAAAIDGSDVIHIVWQDRNGGSNTRVRYNTFSTSTDTWGTAENIDANVGSAPDDGQGDQWCSIALDSNGKAHVAYLYHDGTRRRVAYRNRVSGTWTSITNPDDSTYTGNRKAWHPCIAFDSSGRRVFAWEVGAFNEDTDGQICVRVMDTDDSFGTRQDLGSTTAKVGIDQSTSLMCRGGVIHIAWILGGTPGTEYIRYAYASEAKTPTFSTNHPTNLDSHNPSIAPGPNGKVRIWNHGSESTADDNMYYLESNGGSDTWSSRQLFASGAFDASVSARWSQYFWNFTNTLDIAFWDQNYPNNLYYGCDFYS